MPKATIEGILAINQLLKKYEHSATIPKAEREAVLRKAWPDAISKKDANLETKFKELRKSGLTKVKAIAQMYRDGYTAVEVSKGAHVNRHDVLTALHFQGLATNRRYIYLNVIQSKLEEVRQLTSLGYTRAQVADRIGVTCEQLTMARCYHPALATVLNEADAAWHKRKIELSKQTKEERINHD